MSTDKQFAEKSPYYVYQLSRPEDIRNDTLQRRLMKRSQANNCGFLFDLKVYSKEFLNYFNFLKINFGSHDAILLSWTDYKTFPMVFRTINEHPELTVFFVLTDDREILEIQTLLVQGNRFAVLQLKNRKQLFSAYNVFVSLDECLQSKISFFPQRYSIEKGQLISTLDYLELLKLYQLKCLPRNDRIPFWNDRIDPSFELEPLIECTWSINEQNEEVIISVIIPTYNNARFLVNVLTHLSEQKTPVSNYEVIIVDDGSNDDSSEIVRRYVQSHQISIKIKYFYWSKENLERGPQKFFRPGQARNLGARFANGEYFVFLDSDMLVPKSFIEDCVQALQQNDLIQFQRFHVNQKLSQTNPRWENIVLENDCYIEEKFYWTKLFECDDWNKLPHKWKYVCTYALGLRRKDFFSLGRLKRHFISYGFEDTDLGFRMHLLEKKFSLVKVPLLHLTNYSQMQYQNSSFKRHELLSETAKIFFLDHLNLEIGITLRTFLGAEKNLRNWFKDRFLSN